MKNYIFNISFSSQNIMVNDALSIKNLKLVNLKCHAEWLVSR